jgi:hypothetical protein
MKLPKKVKILGKTYTVECFDFDSKVQANNLNGNISYNKQIIQIDSTLHKDQQNDVLLHEAIHAIDNELCLKLDEQTIRLLGVGLYQFLNDNGFLVQQ